MLKSRGNIALADLNIACYTMSSKDKAMMGRRQRLRGGDEWDVVQHAPLCIFDKPGVKKKTKRRMNKRWRKEFKRLSIQMEFE